MYDWDEAKRQANLAKHGVDFAAMVDFDWTTADLREDQRNDYGERRIIATGWIGARLFVATVTPRDGQMRIIGLRKANPRERKRYDQGQKLH
jgi:uncharacterized protein